MKTAIGRLAVPGPLDELPSAVTRPAAGPSPPSSTPHTARPTISRLAWRPGTT